MTSKFIQKCNLRQTELKESKDYIIEKCSECGELFYKSIFARRTQWCCKCRHIRNQESGRKNYKKTRKIIFQEGFPKELKFETRKDVDMYLEGDGETKIQCLICGNWYCDLTFHVMKKHDISVKEYKEKFGIPFTLTALCGKRKKVHLKKKGYKLYEEHVTGDTLKEACEKAAKKTKGQTPKRSKTTFYEKHKKENLVSYMDDKIQEKAIFPCNKCGKNVIRTVLGTIHSGCRILCYECKEKKRLKRVKDKRIILEIIKCTFCKKDFQPTKKTQKFCCFDCRNNYYRKHKIGTFRIKKKK